MSQRFPLQTNQLFSVVCIVPANHTPSELFLQQLYQQMQAVAAHHEVILIDNGGAYTKRKRWQQWLTMFPNLRILHLATQVSHDMAYHAGLHVCIGDYACLLCAGLDSPHVIPYLCATAIDNNEVIKATRQMSTGKGLLGLAPMPSHTYLLQRSAITALLRLQSRHRHLPTMIALLSLQCHTCTLPQQLTEHSLPNTETTGQWLWQRFDLLIHHSSIPLQGASLLSLAASGLSLLYMMYVVLIALLKQHVVEGWLSSSLINATLFFVLFLVLAIQSEYLVRILAESQGKPPYVVVWDGYSTAQQLPKPSKNVLSQTTRANPQQPQA